MSREWQQTRQPEYVMPDAVYYQSIWAVRDLDRMKERLQELEISGAERMPQGSVVSDGTRQYFNIRPTEEDALERIILENRVEAIKKALNVVPPLYRKNVMDSIIERKKISDYRSKIWKIWKQRFLFNVARNLSLM